MAQNRFKRGSGCFNCRVCGRLTRDTGNDNGNVGLCPECLELSGQQNEHSDRRHQGNFDQCQECQSQLSGKAKKHLADHSDLFN